MSCLNYIHVFYTDCVLGNFHIITVYHYNYALYFKIVISFMFLKLLSYNTLLKYYVTLFIFLLNSIPH